MGQNCYITLSPWYQRPVHLHVATRPRLNDPLTLTVSAGGRRIPCFCLRSHLSSIRKYLRTMTVGSQVALHTCRTPTMGTIQLLTRRHAALAALCLLSILLLGWHSNSLIIPSASFAGASHGSASALEDDIYNSTLGVSTVPARKLQARPKAGWLTVHSSGISSLSACPRAPTDEMA